MKELYQRVCAEIPGWPKMLLALACVGILGFMFVITPVNSLSSTANVAVHPGGNIEALVKAYPPGTSFTITSGVYRLQSISPKDGDSFMGESGAVLSGAEVLTSFTPRDHYWVANVSAKPRSSYRGECTPAHPACIFPEDLFIDDVPLRRVTDLSEVAPGKWYLDYSAGKAYIGDDPNHHKVEISLVAHAFYGSAKNVTIRGLIIEKYADVAGDGAIEGESTTGALSQGWVIQNDEIKLNHGMGIRLGNGMQVLNNKVDDNGQMGLGGSGAGILVAGNEIAYNNYAGYNCGWEAGGTKFTFTRGLVVRNNFVHNNKGPGLWTDIENHDTLYEHNRTIDNKEAGILHEISYHAVIRDNTVENNGFVGPNKTSPWYGGGIVITASENVDVYGNTVTGCMNGIVGLQPDRKSARGDTYFLRNLYVHNNVITQNIGIAAGILASRVFGDSVFTSWGNRFANNAYHLATGKENYFEWLNVPEALAAWKRKGQGH